MAWARDDAKLDRVRALMGEQGLDAIVARAPDNVLYLTNFWGMKGYDAVLFPRDGDPTLFCLEASAEDAARDGVDGRRPAGRGVPRRRPAPPSLRTLERAADAARARHVGLELSLGTQASDRMVGEPTTYTKGWFDAFPNAVDATPLLAAARAIKTTQELERMRLANEIAAAAMDHVARGDSAGQTEAQIASEWLGFVHGEGTGWAGKVELALGFSLVWAGPGIKTFTATTSRPVVEDEPTLFEIWVCADGYWADHTKNVVVGELTDPYRELEAGLPRCTTTRSPSACPARASPSSTDGSATGSSGSGTPASRRIRSATASARGPTSRPTHIRPAAEPIEAGMVLAIEPGCYWDGGRRPAARGQLPDHRRRRRRSSARSRTASFRRRRDNACVESNTRTPERDLDRSKIWTG